MLERQFHLAGNRTSPKTEILAGITTFLTMAYIIFVNPAILSATGMDTGALFVATCLAAAFGSAMMGLAANYPIALAPGMGLNAYFTYSVVLGSNGAVSWQAALGAVFISGVIFLILSVLPVREWIINAIPKSLKMAIGAGIGLFLGIIALQAAGIVVDHPVTMVTIGSLHAPSTILAVLGFFVMVALDRLKVPGAIIIAILATTTAGILLGVSEFKGIFSAPPSLAPTFLAMDLRAATNLGLVAIIFTFLFVDLFDNTGTLIGVAHRAGLIGPDGRIPRLGRALVSDSSAAMVGAALGTSTTTSYIESAAGVKAGGRTGMTAVVVAILFLAALVLSPLANPIPGYATAPALLYVACLMTRGLTEIDWEDATEFAPAVITAIAMPLTFSITDGIALGAIVYAALMPVAGRAREVHPLLYAFAALFLLRYALLT
ncbi:MAG: NCS2 family permease [Pseudomonadota bacterium]